ncbi:MAG TPA: hypothetical protein VG603_15595, partial [Chitinophagales bacterium]|nr:hypothetical protein [Chitinophagales bacterium]
MGQLLHTGLYFLYASAMVYLVGTWRFFRLPGISSLLVRGGFLLHVAAGVALTLIYTYYYTDRSKADIYRFFNDGRIISSVLFTNPVAWLKIITGIGYHDPDAWQYLARTLHFSHPEGDLVTSYSFFIRLVSVLNLLSFNNIFIDTLLLNFIAFTGLVLLYKAFQHYFADLPVALFIGVFLLPSVVFWGSGLLKEALVLVGA